jgi:hypothetical protein
MKAIKCNQHGEKFTIPTEDNEFISGKFHSDVERCQLHHEQYPECRFIEEVYEQ